MTITAIEARKLECVKLIPIVSYSGIGGLRDRSGEVYGNLTVLQGFRRSDNNTILWKCMCKCGREHFATSDCLNHMKSCGCGKAKHGHTKGKRSEHRKPSKEYTTWHNAKRRCHDPKNTHYARYGGRGIKMCEKWRTSFLAFIEDMGSCPVGHTLNRIDNDGDYEPSNCEWATIYKQANNRSNNRRVSLNGITKTIAEWERHLGYYRGTIRRRLYSGWSEQDALSRVPEQRLYRRKSK